MRKISRLLEHWFDGRIDWKLVIALFLLPVIAIRLFIPPTLHNITWQTILNAEAALFYWTEHGYTNWTAFVAGASCGCYCLFFWWSPLIICLRKNLRKQTELPRRYRGFRNYIDHSNWALLRKARNAGERVYYFFVPRRYDDLDPNDPAIYKPLLWYFFMPSGEWTGICYALDRRLYAIIVIPIMAAMNILKIIVFGELGVLLVRFPIFHHEHLTLFMGLFALPFVNKYVEKWLRRKARTKIDIRLLEAKINGTPSS